MMTLFVAIHQHAPDHCPARDPAMGPALLSHLSPATAGQYGVSLRAEAVADDKHTLYLIAEAGDEELLRRYLAPFAQAGSVEVLPGSPCEAVIGRGGCAQAPADQPQTQRGHAAEHHPAAKSTGQRNFRTYPALKDEACARQLRSSRC